MAPIPGYIILCYCIFIYCICALAIACCCAIMGFYIIIGLPNCAGYCIIGGAPIGAIIGCGAPIAIPVVVDIEVEVVWLEDCC